MPLQDTRIGRYVETVSGGEKVRAYVPPPLPPVPPIRIDKVLPKLSLADQAIGRLDGISMLLPDRSLFLYMYVRKEAVQTVCILSFGKIAIASARYREHHRRCEFMRSCRRRRF